MTRRLTIALILSSPIVLTACVEKPPQAIAPPRPAPAVQSGLDRVMGQNAQALRGLFGDPDFDVHEGTARKLQFASSVCVLDAYLYPPAAGREPVVRYIDSRLPNGDDFDRASCIAALSRRGEAR
jgi:hypothetical protein